jgi:ribosomal protein S18 acetylase RimI-like enzyme
MKATTMEQPSRLKVRRLARTDLDAVVKLDAALSGRTRRAYFERRLAIALRQPDLHLQFAVEQDGAHCGHALARVLEGEFGASGTGLRLEVISVAEGTQGRGAGRALHEALEQEAAKRSIGELRTTVAWREHDLLQFLDRLGYALAPSHVIECALRTSAADRPGGARGGEKRGDPNDWSAPVANDYEPLARDSAEVSLLTAKDLDDIVRIDRHITGRDRRIYMQRALDEALRESGVRISLAARQDGVMAGYIMARADLGDFGRTEPVAVIDTIGVAPEYANQGIGHALLSQLFLNLSALRVERVETIVAASSVDLLGFFYGAGFAPGERLAFVKRLG